MYDFSDDLLCILNNILDVSKLDNMKIKLKCDEVQLDKLVENLMESYKIQAKAKGIYLGYKIEGIPHTVKIDKSRLTQILNNLISNSIKFTDNGSVHLYVRKISDISSNECMISFRIVDTGIGIEQKNLGDVFKKFEQSKNLGKRKHEGAGLGLYITQSLVSLFNGTISVSSKIGKGSIFTVKMPFTILPEERLEKNSSGQQFNNLDKLDGLKILVVDDNKMNRVLAGLFLKKHGVNIHYAECGTEALQKIESNDFDMVLMDLEMPGMSGTQVLKEIRTNLKLKLPVIACTGHPKKLTKNEFSGYIRKPYNESTLTSAILSI